jgi:hypothetical protein
MSDTKRMNKTKNYLRHYSNEYVCEKFKNHFNTFNKDDTDRKNIIFDKTINNLCYFKMNSMNRDWLLNIFFREQDKIKDYEKTLDNLVKYSSLYLYDNRLFNYSCLMESFRNGGDYMLDIILSIHNKIKDGEIIEIKDYNYKDFFNLELVDIGVDTYRKFLIYLQNENDKFDLSLSSISWYRLLEEWNDDDKLMDIFIEDAEWNGKSSKRFKFMKFNEFDLFGKYR